MESNTSDAATSGEKNGLGGRIRQLRLQRKISLQKLAAMSDLTSSTISQLERNLTNPSIPALRRIAAALNVPVFFFFMDEQTDESDLIVRYDKRKSILTPNRNVSFELLSPSLNKEMEVIEMKLDPGVESSGDFFTHIGEEACIVIKGDLHILLGENGYTLNEGDCIQFNSGVPHRYINESESETRLIVVITPPSF